MSIHDEFDLNVRLTSNRSMQESGRPGRTDATVDQITCQTCNGTCLGDTCQTCQTQCDNTCQGHTCEHCLTRGLECVPGFSQGCDLPATSDCLTQDCESPGEEPEEE